MVQLTTTLEKFDSNLWGYHFPIPEKIAKQFIHANNRRVICNINHQFTLRCAIMPNPDSYFILINQNLVKKLGLSIHTQVQLEIEKDLSEYGHEVPESFSLLMDQDQEGRTYFDQLTPGRKRSLIYLVGKVKNLDSQINKGLAILHHLKQENGALDFKKLNQLIKKYNQRTKMK